MLHPPAPRPCPLPRRPCATRWILAASLLALSGCAAPDAGPGSAPGRPGGPQAVLAALLPTDVLLLGEQHDAPEHQRLQRETVQWLAARGQLAAVVLEMAEQGHRTAGLPPTATEAQVRAALQWNDAAWPWQAYGPVVMAAVAAGVPVLGGNLPRAQMRAAMADTAWDRHLPAAALQRQLAALRDGHCGLLPENQLAPMARIQIARDASLARTAKEAVRPGRTVVLVAGGGHVLRSLGVPTHWREGFRYKVLLAKVESSPDAINSEADAVLNTPAPPRDHCAELRQQQRPSQPLPQPRP